MIRKDRELLARLNAVCRDLEVISQHVGEPLGRPLNPDGSGGLSATDLRTVGYRLVSLAGDLTTLGIDTARWADDLDNLTIRDQ